MPKIKQDTTRASVLESLVVYILIFTLVIGAVILLNRLRTNNEARRHSSDTSGNNLVIENEKN